MTPRLVHLLRHGAPETPGLLLGRTDMPSTPAGITACLEQVRDVAFDRIVASDLARAASAAQAIGARHNLSVTLDPRWRELDFGAWDGRATADLDTQALTRFWNDPERHPPPQGETWSALAGRVAVALTALDGPATLVVTHGGAMRAALSHLCGIALAQLWAFDLPYAALLSLRIWPGDAPSAQIIGLRPCAA